jgi:hypothetical protein
MKPEFIRTYFEKGTNGALLHNGAVICTIIGLPDRYNPPLISCITEVQVLGSRLKVESLVGWRFKVFGWCFFLEKYSVKILEPSTSTFNSARISIKK